MDNNEIKVEGIKKISIVVGVRCLCKEIILVNSNDLEKTIYKVKCEKCNRNLSVLITKVVGLN